VGGIHLLGIVGLLLGIAGAGMLVAPRWLSFALRLLGMRWDPHDASRVAAWGLVTMGLVIVVLTRAVR
jgi:hypothetical protein